MKSAAVLLCLARAAFADHTAQDTAGAPVPGAESGRIDSGADEQPGIGRYLARGALVVPELVVQTIWLPFEGIFYAFDRYHLSQLYYDVFFNENRTIGVVPTLVYQSGFGLSAGARFVATNVLGEKERLGVQLTTGAITGEHYREGALVELHSGQRFGKTFELSLAANFDRRPAEPFYGIGNHDDSPPPAMPVDPRTAEISVPTYHRYQEARVALTSRIQLAQDWRANVMGSLTDLEYAPSSSGIPIGEVYTTADLPGFVGGVQHAYGELELRWDTRHRSSDWEPGRLFTRGSLISAFVGRVDRIDGGVDFWRYGAELQHFFRIAGGPRVLIVRARASGVSGSRSDVPFTELPTLGGGDFLRGYTYERFRDRAAMFGSLQYEWDLSHFASAYIFTDVGRVYDSFDDVTFHDQRVGYGIGLDLRGDSGFLFTANVASSIDGGLFFTLEFNPVTDALQRWR